MVAHLAGGNAVLPGVLTTSAPREHVVDRLAVPPAVGAPVIVPAHERRPGQRDAVALRDADIATEPDNEGGNPCARGGVQQPPAGVVMDNLRLVAKDEADGPPE